MKRVLIIADLHSGHQVGLTHPKFERRPEDTTSRQYKYYQIRRKMWKWYAETVADLQPIDVLIVNGDCIDGRGEKSGGLELLLLDRNEQVDCAVACINECKANKVLISYGTAYHSGQIEDIEDIIAKDVKAIKIESHGFVSIEGLRFDYRHHVGNTSIPYGQFTPIAKEKLWAQLWAQRDEYPDCEILVRSHVHRLAYCGGTDWLALTTPSLQAYWTKYGTRRMSGTIDFGVVWFDIVDKDTWTWHYRIKRLKSHQNVLKV
ncbi:hypothetical protein MUP59_08230 [Candidatus Bathyarchaeota archaeon]|nr:hypothetical protein [Candidatus Bathyarchaeota archaeon]